MSLSVQIVPIGKWSMPPSATACRCDLNAAPGFSSTRALGLPHIRAPFISVGAAPCSCTRLQFHHPRFPQLCLPPQCLRSRCEWMSTCSHPLTTRVQFCQPQFDCCSSSCLHLWLHCCCALRQQNSMNQSMNQSILICMLAKSQPELLCTMRGKPLRTAGGDSGQKNPPLWQKETWSWSRLERSEVT